MRGLSPPTFQSGGARAPPAPPISPPMINIIIITPLQYHLTAVAKVMATWYGK